MKVICMYLPQYHEFPENNEWWGQGYTEWTAVKRAKPLFAGHIQPRVPLNRNYYDLHLDGVSTLKWQAELANEYGVYGFCFYQYYFKGKKLMQTPMEILLSHKEIPMRYCICWANETWTRTWYGLADQVLMKQEYGTESDWRNHFDYLLPFFQDERYIKVDGKPVFQIYRSFDIEKLKDMLECFQRWAREAGFAGIYVVSGKTAGEQEKRKQLIDGYYFFEPGYTLKHDFGAIRQKQYEISVFCKTLFNKLFHKQQLERSIKADWILSKIEQRTYAENEFPGLIPDWDNTPRRSYKGLVYKGTTPERFEKTLRILKDKVAGRACDFVYINAWNEWGEGAFLEPDESRGYAYLEAVKRVMSEDNHAKG